MSELPQLTTPSLDIRSRELRRKMLLMMESGGRGHLASALSVLEIVRVLYDDILQVDPRLPHWPARDRFILSKGHGCMALYAVLADKGFFPESAFLSFCKSGGLLGGHPEIKVPGVEATTGSLGHGLPIGVGFALSAKLDKAPRRVFVVIGDGESGEGSIWEAALCAHQHALSNLTVIVDYNKKMTYGPTCDVLDIEPLADKWRSFGFAVAEVDGHNVAALRMLFSQLPLQPSRPTAIIAHTIKGKGIAPVEHDLSWHHKSKISKEEVQVLYAALEVG